MQARLVLAGACALAAACPAPSTPAPTPVVNRATATATAPDVPLGHGVEILLATSGDVDGDGASEPVELRSNGQLRVGGWSLPVPLDRIDDPAFWTSDSVLRVVGLRAGTAAVVLTTPTEGIEDPPHRHRMYVVEGGAVREVMDEIVGTPRSGLRFPGDGTARYDQGAWEACEQRGYPAVPVPLDEVAISADADGRYHQRSRHPSGKQFACADLAACPFVYVVDAGGAHRIGEVLRDVRGAAAYTLQSLALPEPATSTLTIRVTEEKPEVTYLDEVYVEIGGIRHAPRACSSAAPPAYCVADHVAFVLRQGDALDLAVDVDTSARGPVGGPTAVFARGYYVPL